MKNEQELERQKLVMVELPNLLHRILHLSIVHFSANKEFLEKDIDEIKK